MPGLLASSEGSWAMASSSLRCCISLRLCANSAGGLGGGEDGAGGFGCCATPKEPHAQRKAESQRWRTSDEHCIKFIMGITAQQRRYRRVSGERSRPLYLGCESSSVARSSSRVASRVFPCCFSA